MATNSNNSNSNNINSGKLLNPPVLINVDNIDSWLHDLEIWRCVTGLDKKQQGPIIYLSLPEKIKQSCRDLKIPALNSDNGLDLLVDKLEKLYVKDSKTTTYLAYEKFESFQRPVNMTIQDYLNEFERLYNDIMRFKIELPSAVLAYRLLKSANLSEEKQQLARATISDLTYDNMKRQLKAIHDSLPASSNQSLEIKKEPTFVAETTSDNYFSNNSSNNFSGNKSFYHGRYNHRRGNYNNRGRQGKPNNFNSRDQNTDKWGCKTNPLDSSGNISKSSICHSIYHWYQNCPEKVSENSDSYDIKLNLFTKEVY